MCLQNQYKLPMGSVAVFTFWVTFASLYGRCHYLEHPQMLRIDIDTGGTWHIPNYVSLDPP